MSKRTRRLVIAAACIGALVVGVTAAKAEGATRSASGCTGGLFGLESCIDVDGSGTDVVQISPGEVVDVYDGGPWLGRFRVLKDGDLFLQSGWKYESNCNDPDSHGCGSGWYWHWRNGGDGWTLPLGTELCGGFYTAHGDWFGGGPSCITIG